MLFVFVWVRDMLDLFCFFPFFFVPDYFAHQSLIQFFQNILGKDD